MQVTFRGGPWNGIGIEIPLLPTWINLNADVWTGGNDETPISETRILTERWDFTYLLTKDESGNPRYDLRSTAASDDKVKMKPQQIRLLYDGQCALCRRAMEGLQRRDAKGRIIPEDISDPAFNPARYRLTAEQVRTAMCAVLPDGRILRAMDAVRAVYGAVGLGWLVAPTAWPGIRWLADVSYRFFARHRLTFSRMLGQKCDSGSCSLHARR